MTVKRSENQANATYKQTDELVDMCLDLVSFIVTMNCDETFVDELVNDNDYLLLTTTKTHSIICYFRTINLFSNIQLVPL